jgi:hypothetical protein
MGSFGAGLASVGGSIAQAQELQRQQKLEDIKLALENAKLGLEKTRIGTEQEYAKTAGIREQREKAEFEERKRLANLPKFVGFRSVGGKLYYGLQNPDGSVKITEATGVSSAEDATALEQAIEGLPAEAQDAARSAIVPYLQTQDYQGARGALKPIMQKYTESLFPGQATVTDTTETHTIQTPQGPKVVQFPKHTVQRKVPGGAAGAKTSIPGAVPTAKSKTAAPPVPRSPAQLAQDLGLPSGSKVLGSKPFSPAEVSKLIDPVQDADRRYKVMLDSAKHPDDPQSNVALLFNHIGMTLSAQRGARITTAEIGRAISARSLGGDLQVLYDKWVEQGQFLTPIQIQGMLRLGRANREFLWQQAWDKAKSEKMTDYLPAMDLSLGHIPRVHYLGEDVTVKGQGKSRITKINPDGSYEVKPY